MYQKFGLVEEYWKTTGSMSIDKGRVEVTQDPADTYVFKVPSLRNVARTPPTSMTAQSARCPKRCESWGGSNSDGH
jgi:cytochrome c peroxidase